MDGALKLVNEHAGLIQEIGFYVFFLGFLVLLAVVIPLLFDRERWVIPCVILAILLIGGSAVQLEKRKPLIDFSGPAPKIVLITKEVSVPVLVPIPTETRSIDKRRSEQERRESSRKPSTRTTERRERTTRETRKPPQVRPTRERPAPKPTPTPTPAPKPAPTPSPPKPKPAPPPSSPGGERTDEGLVLPTGNLVIQVTDTLILTVPKPGSKARMSVYFDGRYVGGRGASSMKQQKNEQGEVIKVTYFWKGVTVRLNNQTTGNHRVSVSLKVSGNGVKKSVNAWSGGVHIGGGTSSVVLKGSWGNKLRRIK